MWLKRVAGASVEVFAGRETRLDEPFEVPDDDPALDGILAPPAKATKAEKAAWKADPRFAKPTAAQVKAAKAKLERQPEQQPATLSGGAPAGKDAQPDQAEPGREP